MKKRLEAELISIAHRILKLKGKEDLHKIHAETQKLYELLSVLKFAEDNHNVILPKINLIEFEETLSISLDNFQKNETFSKITEENEIAVGSVFSEPYIEPVFEKISDLKTEIEFIKKEITETNHDEFQENNVSETIITNTVETEKPVGAFNISLNDRIGFVQRLFDNNNEDFNRVLSQLSTFDSYAEAKDFIVNIVKLDYDNWSGNEDFEERFMSIVAEKFNS